MKPLEGRTALITGANRGFGLAIAQAYLDAGANLMLCARDVDLLMEAQQTLMASAEGNQQVFSFPCDVSNPDDIDKLVKILLERYESVQILVNNAGVYGPKGLIEENDWFEWVKAIEINLFSVALTIRALMPHFRKQNYGKIINLSGGGATSPMPRLSAYAASKAAVVRLTETIAKEVDGCGIDINAVAPGALNTRLLDDVIEAGPEKVGQAFYNRMVKIKQEGGVPMEKGAALCVFLGSSASDGLSGKLLSALWDDWGNLPEHLDELQKTDIYTLRRIVARDRGKPWGDL